MTSTPGSSTLKERIAALQKRSPSPQLSSPPRKVASGGSIPKNALRDKIARFEEKGSTSKPKATIGLGKPPAKADEQFDVRIKSLGSIPLTSSRIGRLSRSASETSEIPRDSASSPTCSSREDTLSETYGEDMQSQSPVSHSPRSGYSHEMTGATLSNSDDDLNLQAVPISMPLITSNSTVGPLSNRISGLDLEGIASPNVRPRNSDVIKTVHNDNHSLKGDAETLPDTIDPRWDTRKKDNDQSLEGFTENDRSCKVVFHASTTPRGVFSAECSRMKQRSLNSTLSAPTSLDDPSNQVLPILDAFPTVPGHIPSSQSSRFTSALSHQTVINSSASNSKSISNIHSIPPSTSPIASHSPTVMTSSNNLETLPTPLLQPSQGRKSVPRPKSSVPFWYDDDSDDGEPGWVSVTVTTRRY